MTVQLLDHQGQLFRHMRVRVNKADLHVAIGGSGSPVYLIHGCPKTMTSWHRLVPYLTERHTIVLLDLRGFGDSERTVDGYDTRSLAQDVAVLATHLGHSTFRIMGEDWGAAVAYAVAAFHRERVTQLVYQEMRLPGCTPDESIRQVSADDTRSGWHFAFFQLPGYPELLLAGREQAFWAQFLRRQAYNPTALDDDIDEVIANLSRPGGLHAVLSLYRAHPLDVEQNHEQLKCKLVIPVLAVGGEHYLGEEVHRHMKQAAIDVQGVVMARAGHHPALETPEELARHILDFFTQRSIPEPNPSHHPSQ